MRDAEVHPPKTAATLSFVSSLPIFSAKTVGSLYDPSEAFSEKLLQRAEAACKAHGLKWIAVSVSSSSEIVTGTQALKYSDGFTRPLPIAIVVFLLFFFMGQMQGGGGRLMQDLIREVFVRAFDNPMLTCLHDGATWPVEKGTVAFTTDSYVVHPLFFPGGDIGSLAVHGTINDLAMCGAKPLYLSAGFILEEGLSLDVLQQVVDSMAKAACGSGTFPSRASPHPMPWGAYRSRPPETSSGRPIISLPKCAMA